MHYEMYICYMKSRKLHIKNMVCQRCIKVVGNLLEEQQISVESITLGEVILRAQISKEEKEVFEAALKKEGFELINNKQSALVSAIKNEIINLIHYRDISELKENISYYLAKKLHRDYHTLSKVFSETENLTIEQFVIFQKTEKVKELLVYDEFSLSEIAFKMGYSSTAHLSAQFKKVTGFAPSKFKKLKGHRRKALDDI